MNNSGHTAGRPIAIILVFLSLIASALLAMRCYRLRTEFNAESETLARTRNSAAMVTLESFSLPPNRKMEVCNNSGEAITISALTASYTDPRGRPLNFNSASNQWHAWSIPAGSRQKLDLTEHGAAVWDGSVIFYAMYIARQGKELMLSGTSDDLRNGCIPLSTKPTGENN